MPLLLITGYPASGKSTIAHRISNYFKESGYEGKIEIITEENDLNFTRSLYGDFKKEKEIRSLLRSTVQRSLMDKTTLVICDSLNHIKGYRYELYTMAKNFETRYAVLSCNFPLIVCQWLNHQKTENLRYSEKIFTELISRYEQPDAKNRWDSPLIKANKYDDNLYQTMKNNSQYMELEEDEQNNKVEIETFNSMSKFCPDENKLPQNILLPLKQLYCSLVEGKELNANKCVRSNVSKMSLGLSINEIDLRTQAITNNLMSLQQSAMPGDNLVILTGNENLKINFTRHRSLPQLTRIRQQFLHYIRTHPQEDINAVEALFVNYLNSNP